MHCALNQNVYLLDITSSSSSCLFAYHLSSDSLIIYTVHIFFYCISILYSNGKIHEEDYRRETQTNVPMLGPEILAVFANSQIFQDHQPTKLNRISTKIFLPGVHSPHRELPTTPRETDEARLIRRLEGNNDDDDDVGSNVDYVKSPSNASGTKVKFYLN